MKILAAIITGISIYGIAVLVYFSDIEGDIEYEVKKMELEKKSLDTEENLEKIKERKHNPKKSKRIAIALIWTLAIVILNLYANGQLEEIIETFKKFVCSFN